ncbi:MAG: TIR domain-containing protein [Atopobiaceae bacterium]|nr:TIR domain-containing protein [Atopobiaceae bacterium]
MPNNHPFDVFLSYEHTSKLVADNIVAKLESRRIRCWYAPRDVRGGYAGSIMDAISNCRVFVIILNQRSSQSPQVLNEVEAAYGRVMSGGLPIIPFRLDVETLSNEMQYYLKRLHWIDASDGELEKAIDSLADQIFEILPDVKEEYQKSLQRNAPASAQSKAREANRYYELYDEKATDESQWLHLQNLILRDFDMPIYDRLLKGRENVAVLDIGCSDGEVLHDRLGFRDEVTSLLGVDANVAMLDKARMRFASDSRYTFMEADCENVGIRRVLEDYLHNSGLTGFDFVNISMVLLHLKRPYVTLRSIRPLLNENACVFVRDIDDGFNVAYPDEEGTFARLNSICASLPTTGCRTSGRQIYSMLRRAGYKDIVLERSGLSTVGMNHDQRYAMFMTCFDWLGGDLNLRCQEHPNNDGFRDDRDWFEEKVYDFEEQFQDPTFFYQEGFVTYTARVPSRASLVY